MIIGNWKMYKTSSEAEKFISAIKAEIKDRVFLAVPFTAIEAAVRAAAGTEIIIGAQNMHDEAEGAFTGEVAAHMLKASGAGFVILGHSERRQYFGENNAFIHRKVMRALHEGLTPVLCVGELEAHRKQGEQERVIELQLTECLQQVGAELACRLVIAYEPVWAIGTGRAATPEIAQAMHSLIRDCLKKHFGKECSEKIPLLYGGSVKPENIGSLMQQPDIDGALVGGASLDPRMFAQIVRGSQ